MSHEEGQPALDLTALRLPENNEPNTNKLMNLIIIASVIVLFGLNVTTLQKQDIML